MIIDELPSGIYTFKGLSEVSSRNLQLEYDGVDNSRDNEHDDISMKPKLVERPSNIAIRFEENSSSSSILGFTPHRHYKPYDEYISKNFTKLRTVDKIHLNCDVFDGSVVNGVRQPIMFSFVLDTPSG